MLASFIRIDDNASLWFSVVIEGTAPWEFVNESRANPSELGACVKTNAESGNKCLDNKQDNSVYCTRYLEQRITQWVPDRFRLKESKATDL